MTLREAYRAALDRCKGKDLARAPEGDVLNSKHRGGGVVSPRCLAPVIGAVRGSGARCGLQGHRQVTVEDRAQLDRATLCSNGHNRPKRSRTIIDSRPASLRYGLHTLHYKRVL